MICPKFPAVRSPFALLYTGWLTSLNASPRNYGLKRSLIGVESPLPQPTTSGRPFDGDPEHEAVADVRIRCKKKVVAPQPAPAPPAPP